MCDKDTIRIRDRSQEGLHTYPDYKFIEKNWTVMGSIFDPTAMTIQMMKDIIKLYENPKNPSEKKWTYVPINFKKPLNELCQNQLTRYQWHR